MKALEQVPGQQKNADKKGKKEAPYYEDFILMDGDQSLAVSLVFNSAPVLDVIPAFADVLGFNFISDAELKNTVTLNINSNMTKRELWNTVDRMLTLAGATVRVDGSMLRILPVSKLARQPDLSVNEQISNEVCYYPLKNTTAKNVIAQLKPFLSKDAAISEFTRIAQTLPQAVSEGAQWTAQEFPEFSEAIKKNLLRSYQFQERRKANDMRG